jgi:hypothetical protein
MRRKKTVCDTTWVLPRITINADDFGRDHASNEAVETAWKAGVISSASLIGVSEFTNEAAAIARRLKIPCGVHVCLISERACRKLMCPILSPGLRRHGKHAYTAPGGIVHLDDETIFNEAAAQVRRVRKLVGKITHIDFHMRPIPRCDGRFSSVLSRLTRAFRVPIIALRCVANLYPAGSVLWTGRVSGRTEIAKTHSLELLAGNSRNGAYVTCHVSTDAAGEPGRSCELAALVGSAQLLKQRLELVPVNRLPMKHNGRFLRG